MLGKLALIRGEKESCSGRGAGVCRGHSESQSRAGEPKEGDGLGGALELLCQGQVLLSSGHPELQRPLRSCAGDLGAE